MKVTFLDEAFVYIQEKDDKKEAERILKSYHYPVSSIESILDSGKLQKKDGIVRTDGEKTFFAHSKKTKAVAIMHQSGNKTSITVHAPVGHVTNLATFGGLTYSNARFTMLSLGKLLEDPKKLVEFIEKKASDKGYGFDEFCKLYHIKG